MNSVGRLSRPWQLAGDVLATRRIVPAAEDWRVLASGAVVIGPLAWISVLAVNDAHYLRGDVLNPRKAETPLKRWWRR